MIISYKLERQLINKIKWFRAVKAVIQTPSFQHRGITDLYKASEIDCLLETAEHLKAW